MFEQRRLPGVYLFYLRHIKPSGVDKSGLVTSRTNITRIKRCDVLKRKKSCVFRPSLNLDEILELQVA